MGCCSSRNSVEHTKSPTNAPVPNDKPSQLHIPSTQTNIQCIDPSQLQQHHDINRGGIDGAQSMKNIENEVMRLQEFEFDDDHNNDNNAMEIKSNEVSEDLGYNQSIEEMNNATVNIMHQQSPSHKSHYDDIDEMDSPHPFGIIQPNNSKYDDHHRNDYKYNNGVQGEEIMENLESLYEENLKQHGFDADKFRTANRSLAQSTVHSKRDTKEFSQSADISSFASSQLSSKSMVKDEPGAFQNDNDYNVYEEEDEEEEEEDLFMEELSRPNSFYEDGMNGNEYDGNGGYIDNIKEMSVKGNHGINNIMDDEDEELMDAILSLDLDD